MKSFKEMLLVLSMMLAAGFAGYGVYKYVIAPQNDINNSKPASSSPSQSDAANTFTTKSINEETSEAGKPVDLAALVVKDIDANPIGLDQWQGKVLAINFWATWCPPCRKEIPLLIDAQNDFAENNVQFLGIAMDDAKAVATYMETAGFNYPILISDLNETIKIGQAVNYNFVALPFTVFISADGTQSKAHTGELTVKM